MLTLPIEKKWFEMILNGVKKDEYRDSTPYYTKRLSNLFQIDEETLISCVEDAAQYNKSYEFICSSKQICLRNGYCADSRKCIANCTLAIGRGKISWGAKEGKVYYILNIRDIEKLEREKK